MKKRRKISLKNLFYNNRFVLFFSVLCAIVLWFVMASTNTEERPMLVSDVPINIKLSDTAQANGLKVISPVDAKAKVYIKGNSLIVRAIKNTDMEVVAQLASTITEPGTYPLQLTVQKKGTMTNYEIDSFDPGTITVRVDRYLEKSFEIEDHMQYKVDSDHFVSAVTYGLASVTVSGPETEVSRVKSVVVKDEIAETLTETKHFTTNLVMLDENGDEIQDENLKLSAEAVDVTISVLLRKILPLKVEFVNKPSGLTLSSSQITIDPVNIEIAGPEDSIANLTEITLDPIDFSGLSPSNNEAEASITLPQNYKNLSNIYSAKVKIDLSGYTTRSMTVTQFVVKGLAANRTARVVNTSLPITVVGPESELESLTASNLVATVDMTGKETFTGQSQMPVTISFTNASRSWAFGSYKVSVQVQES